MKRQRGQTLVEFALMAPMIFLLIFGMIYGGVMFIDYLNFNNEARAVARQIAVANTERRAELMTEYPAVDGKSFSRFYNVHMKAAYLDVNDAVTTDPVAAEDVMVTVNFERDNKDLPWIVYKVGFPPKKFAITYRMRLEKQKATDGG